jgi:hypothetical protein
MVSSRRRVVVTPVSCTLAISGLQRYVYTPTAFPLSAFAYQMFLVRQFGNYDLKENV